MKTKLGNEPWYRYRCDGPLCNPHPSSITEWLITPESTFCQVDIPDEEGVYDKTIPLSPHKKPDITDYGWTRIIRHQKVCHICRKCKEEFKERLTRRLYKFMQTADRHDLPTIVRIAQICSSPHLYEDLSKDDYIC